MTHSAEDGPAADPRPRRDLLASLHVFAAIPAAVLTLLPSGTCPLCVAGNASVLSGFGLAFLLSTQFQSPLIAAFLLTTLAGVGWTGIKRRDSAPFAIVCAGSLAIIAARFLWSIPILVYVGAVFVIAGTIWSTVRKPPRTNPCHTG